MRRIYEYKLLKDMSPSQLTEANLNALGAQGWELITFQEFNGKFNAIFKRL